MKQVTILSPKANQDNIKSILKGLHIHVFSKIDIEGYSTETEKIDMTNWFGTNKEMDFSVMFLAYVPEVAAYDIMASISNWNKENSQSPQLHAFMMPVEHVV